jgi:RimJ/RimL family protein N-acetyltransferase
MIQTERLQLRKMKETDVDLLLKIFADPLAMKYYPSTKNRAETLEWIQWTLDNYKQHGVGLWIVESKANGQFLGQCGIVPQEVDGEVEWEIGYLFVREQWGNGYATEAARACLDYGFQELQFERMISLPAANNEPSKKVARRIGMHREREIIKWGKAVDLFAIDKKGNENSNQ